MATDPDREALERALAGRGPYELLACDPALADTAVFCAAYGFALEDSANTILVAGKADPPVYGACVVLAPIALTSTGSFGGCWDEEGVVRVTGRREPSPVTRSGA